MVFLSHSDLLYLFQLNSSVGFNIVSAVFSLVGITLFIVELIINTPYIYPVYDPHFPTWGRVPGMAISGLLLIFCLLEVFITSLSAHFGCQLTCYQPTMWAWSSQMSM